MDLFVALRENKPLPEWVQSTNLFNDYKIAWPIIGFNDDTLAQFKNELVSRYQDQYDWYVNAMRREKDACDPKPCPQRSQKSQKSQKCLIL